MVKTVCRARGAAQALVSVTAVAAALASPLPATSSAAATEPRGDRCDLEQPIYNHNRAEVRSRLTRCRPAPGGELAEAALVLSSRQAGRLMAELLLDYGVSPDAISGGSTPLIQAGNPREANEPNNAARRLRVARALVEAGADVNLAAPQSGGTPLSSAAYGNYPNIVRYLLDQCAAPNARDRDGNTALMSAARNGAFRTGALLVDSGVRRFLRNDDGQTAARLADMGRFDRLAAYIRNGGE